MEEQWFPNQKWNEDFDLYLYFSEAAYCFWR